MFVRRRATFILSSENSIGVNTVEIALISAVILIALALLFRKTTAMLVELAKLLGSAFMLTLVAAASLCSPRRRSNAPSAGVTVPLTS
jgi:hypothetical protein